MERDFVIVAVREHFEVYDGDGAFICSADTRLEALQELGAA